MTAEVTHPPAGAPWSGTGDAKTLLDLFVPSCRSDDAPAMIFEDGPVVSRAELLDLAQRFAGFLRERVQPGEVVAIMVANRAEFMIAHLGVCAVRATLVSINPTAKEHDTGHILRDSQAVLAIVDEENRALVEGLQTDCPALRGVVVVAGDEPRGLSAYEGDRGPLDLRDANCEPEDITHIYYTSGTTGLAKGCMLDHTWWLRCVDIELRLNPKGAGDRMLSCLPFYYADPAVMLACTIYSGGTLVVMRRFSVSRFWDVVHAHDVVDMWTIASIPALLLKGEPRPAERDHRIRLAVAVGVQANIHAELVARFGFPFLDNYGSTEATINTRVPVHAADEMVGSGSIGVAIPECEIRIVDTEDEDVPIGESGQILIRTPGLFRGYLNRPEATEEAMRGGWFHTGDLARRDERGFYYFLGRMKDIIRRSGENVAAAEIEEVIRSHPKVLEVAVIAVPDDLRGEEIKAYVLPVDGESPETIPPDELVRHCAAVLAPFKVPRYIEYRDTDFPRTPSLRVRKEALKLEEDLTAGCWDREVEHVDV
ncbi:MAG: AMP-binding protein [Solirubrobacteraceae bacterium]